MQIVLIAESKEANSLGRAYCLWLLARELGWGVLVVTTHGNAIWPPLAGTEFERSVRQVPASEVADAIPSDTDLLIAVKPLPRSLGQAAHIAEQLYLPLLVDVDDPDLEVRRRTGSPALGALRWFRRPGRSIEDLRLQNLARTHPSLVSNPWLQARYGGTLIPHTRLPMESGETRDTSDMQIAFVGTRHPHKGVDVLRSAIRSLQNDRSRTTLVITDDPPDDAQVWETWVGRTSLTAGIDLARSADVVAIPSLSDRRAVGQLPVKLVDALMLGRPLVVSDVEPLPWAIGDAGLVVAPGDPNALASALRALRDPSVRRRLQVLALQRAEEEFSVAVLAPRFAEACRAAVGFGRRANGER
ncbi:glycosyltransferase family 4 protein [Microbacterium sp. MAHUQ-60]|uniref:glycosyltransferase family 4 protein n=1 Tax=unclassified Microbacterium TaxID=2609290 RepID=UPI00360A338F